MPAALKSISKARAYVTRLWAVDYSKLEAPVSQQTTRSRKLSVLEKLDRTWILEATGSLVAAGCITAICFILQALNGQRVPRWPVTINFITSLLGNIARACTLFSVHNSVSQSKWVLFRRRQTKITTLEAFQKARSGSTGALQLIFTLIEHPFVFLGSLAIAMAALWDPFVQNVIRYEDDNMSILPDQALLARSIKYEGKGLINSPGQKFALDAHLVPNIQSALLAQPNSHINDPMFFCSTGNCTWAPFATLAMCSECTDITSSILVNCEDSTSNSSMIACSASLPNNVCKMDIDPQSGRTTFMNITTLRSEALVYKNSGGYIFQSLRLLNFTLGKSSAGITDTLTASNYTATECVLSPCILSLQAAVTKGVYSERILNTFMEEGQGPQSGPYVYPDRLQPPWGPEQGFPKGVTFGWEDATGTRWTQNNFPESFIAGDFTTSEKIEETQTHGGDLMQFIYLANYSAASCGAHNEDTFACVMRDIAASLTSTLRNSNVLTNGSSSADLVIGSISMSVTIIRVQWAWLALPIGIWLVGLIAWAGTAVQTEWLGIPIWRDNPVPLLFLYRDSGDIEKSEGVKDNVTWAYQDVAGRLRVRLKSGSDGLLKLVRE